MGLHSLKVSVGMEKNLLAAAAVLMLVVIVDGAEYHNLGSVEPFSVQAETEIERLYHDLVLSPTGSMAPSEELFVVPSGYQTMPPPVLELNTEGADVTSKKVAQAVIQKVVPSTAQPQLQAPQQAQPPPQVQGQVQRQQPQPTKEDLQKAEADKKVHQAQNFNKLVKETDTLLDDAMIQMKKDRKMFRHAIKDGTDKRHKVKDKAAQAKTEAKGHETQIAAIETHVSIAEKENAKAFIAFAKKFRHTASHTFYKKYNKARRLQSELQDLYHTITAHVGSAITSLEKKEPSEDDKYTKQLKAYYRIKYGCSDKSGCTEKKKAKADKKKAHAALLEFKDTLKTAHRHGKKLRRRLHQALDKLHFVFKEARSEIRKSLQEFHAGYDVHYSARQTISMTAIK